MINNRQGGRRRGRGGQRPQGMPGNSGGQRDNRNRGNAAQLLEKYKGLARDAQLAGDRVQTEYYLQFADHYFRVLEEHRARFEDQQPRRRRDEDEDEDEFVAEGDDGGEDEVEQPRRRPAREPREAREGGRERGEGRAERAPRRANGESRAERQGEEESFFAALPPAIGADNGDDDETDVKPRRRTRRPRAEAANEEGDAAA